MQFPYILTDQTLTVYIDNKPFATDRTNPGWNAIKTEINKATPDKATLLRLIQPEETIKDLVEEIRDVSVRNGHIFYGEDKVHYDLAKRMLDVIDQGLTLDPWVKFVQNVYSNPQQFARQELYDFLEKSDLPITADGCFLAYKIVDSDYKDLYSHTFDNSVGKVVSLPGGRKSVDPDRERTCSYGLHFCSKGYLGHYGTKQGSRVMIVKVNPKDVVAIPVDYNNAKGRTFKYEVVGEVEYDAAYDIKWQAVDTTYDKYYDEEWDSFDDDESYCDYCDEYHDNY